MMSAKDYFYKYYSTQKYGATYAENYNHLSEEDKEKLYHVAQRSNDLLIESYMSDLISVAPPEFRGRIEQCFVGKMRNFAANAAASHADDEHYGDLIFFNVGLSDACFQYATLFQEFVSLRHAKRMNQDNPESSLALTRNILKLARSQYRWKSIGEVALMEEDNLLPSGKREEEISTGIAVMADKFVLYHEVCHHLLGHTSTWGGALLENIPDNCKFWLQETNARHKREFQADAGAIILALWSSKKDQRNSEITAALGALLFLTTIGQFANNAWEETDTHPSEGKRFIQCCNILAELLRPDGDFDHIFKDILKFQTVLFRSQGAGIGTRWEKAATGSTPTDQA